MEVTGIVKMIGPSIMVNPTFAKRDFVLTIEGQYPQHVQFQLMQQKCDLLNNVKVGQEMIVHFGLQGQEWTNPQGEVKYFNTLSAWRIELLNRQNAYTPPASATQQTQEQVEGGGAPPSNV